MTTTPVTPRVDAITWSLHADGSLETSAVYHYPSAAPVPSGTMTLRPEQVQDLLAQAGTELVPQALAAYDAVSTPHPVAGPADVARMWHDMQRVIQMPVQTTPPPAPQTGTAPAID